jgi:hypothetical protein
MKREQLVKFLKELQSDEYDSEEVASMNKSQIVQAIIDCALFYKYYDNDTERPTTS